MILENIWLRLNNFKAEKVKQNAKVVSYPLYLGRVFKVHYVECSFTAATPRTVINNQSFQLFLFANLSVRT